MEPQNNARPHPELQASLTARIRSGDAVVGILGLGSVGLPLAATFARCGLGVIGFDVDAERVRTLTEGRQPLPHLGDELSSALAEAPRFEATTDPSALKDADIKLICVPTPLGPHRDPDLSFVRAATKIVAQNSGPGQLVVLESTTYPGTTRTVVAPLLEAAGLRVGHDVFVAFSPEREDPGRTDWSTRSTPKLVGGLDEASTEIACALYERAIEKVVRTSSAEVAESAKLLENIYRAVNIALVNEMKMVLDAMDIDIWEVIDAASTKPFGFTRFTPGPGMGGHCIPIDPFYLTWIARKAGLSTKFIELAGEINRSMPRYVVERTQFALNSVGRAVRGSRILVLGLAYKPEVGIVSESPSLSLLQQFAELGAEIAYSDPFVPVAPTSDEIAPAVRGLRSIELSPESVASYDAIVLSTSHKSFDTEMIAAAAPLIIDTRNRFGSLLEGSERYFKA